MSIILDGENCWEYYPNGGVDFLRGAVSPRGRSIRRSRRSASATIWPDTRPTDKLGHLFPGSWIQHNFGIWIGHPECNRAWDLLYETRQYLVGVDGREVASRADKLARAWDELYIAEGSDWFWWFGDGHSSAQDGLFDRLFRKHLQNVYLVLDEQPPAELARPISQGTRHARSHANRPAC